MTTRLKAETSVTKAMIHNNQFKNSLDPPDFADFMVGKIKDLQLHVLFEPEFKVTASVASFTSHSLPGDGFRELFDSIDWSDEVRLLHMIKA